MLRRGLGHEPQVLRGRALRDVFEREDWAAIRRMLEVLGGQNRMLSFTGC